METITYCFFGFLVAVYIGLQISIYLMKRKCNKLEREIERGKKAILIMKHVNIYYGKEALKHLPTYNEIVTDTKEVTVGNYLDVNKILNLN